MKKIYFIIVSITALLLVGTAYAATATLGSSGTATVTTTATTVFTRTLTTGATGQDVMALKKILNLELGIVDTSSVYNSTTASAVSQLQEKYAVDILIPSGLSAGTGFVGQATMRKLNLLAVEHNIKLSDFPVPVAAAIGTVFTQTLSLGSTGDQVSLLKNVLNTNLGIKLSATNVFDQATQDAVNKFQQKYASEILTPNGLTTGTGTVGPSTRKKLNSLLQSTLASINTTTISGIQNTVSNTLQNQNILGGQSVQTLYTSSISGVSSSTLCPIVSYTYTPWSSCSVGPNNSSGSGIQTGTETRTYTTNVLGYASNCPDTKPITTQTCTYTPPAVIAGCDNTKPINFGGSIANMGKCTNVPPELMTLITLDTDTQFGDENNNKCIPTSDDYYIMVPTEEVPPVFGTPLIGQQLAQQYKVLGQAGGTAVCGVSTYPVKIDLHPMLVVKQGDNSMIGFSHK